MLYQICKATKLRLLTFLKVAEVAVTTSEASVRLMAAPLCITRYTVTNTVVDEIRETLTK